MSDIKTLDCGCEVIVATNGSVMLTYCPLHKSAPDLYEALEAITSRLKLRSVGSFELPADGKAIKQAELALAKVEGK